jgi:branched-chain amino acid transport system substrate-binding protein
LGLLPPNNRSQLVSSGHFRQERPMTLPTFPVFSKIKIFAACAAICFVTAAKSQQEIEIGVIYPLTCAAASSGAEMKNALEMAADIINNGAKGIPDLPFSAGGGLPGLEGAKIKLVFADHQSNPQTGASEAERLISEEKVVAIVGAYNSNVTATASQVAERNKIPFLNAESSSASLTQRGFKYFFRTTAHDDLFVRNFFEFLKELEAKRGIKVGAIATINENTIWGTETTKLEAALSRRAVSHQRAMCARRNILW